MLSETEITSLISGYSKGTIPDYQASAFLMAAMLKGLTSDETYYLTKSMLQSGQILELDEIKLPKVDKHSTGGVGDKVSLILAPLLAACGVCVPMISGRGLGHTGGTLDKLEAIPGFRTDLTLKEFRAVLKECGCSIIGQTEEVAPADKKLYALRDVTATVDYIPFITASILSKKLAEGADGLVFDVKAGNGAFMPDIKKALALAQTLVKFTHRFNKKSVAVITDMSQPLGRAVGNSLEVIEAIEALKGRWHKDLRTVTFHLGTEMLILAGKCKTRKVGLGILEKAVSSGSALKKFSEMVSLQGGNSGIVEDYSLLPQARFNLDVNSEKRGYLNSIQTQKIGWLAVELGAGRRTKEDRIDPAAGFIIFKKIADKVEKGDCLAEVHSNEKTQAESVAERLVDCFRINNRSARPTKTILTRVAPNSLSSVKSEDLD
ncbi:MAG: thymidine phosphorylase [candidate division Zixibacteria bacterium]|nr:thymidine phosphorylase [candidate division Zixibacteria bacterium]